MNAREVLHPRSRICALLRVPRLVAADWGRRRAPGKALHYGLLALALVLGLTLALAVLPDAGSWLHRHAEG
jgi:hypothetical protein